MIRPDPAIKSLDPRNLIFETYRIEGITRADCRSVFLDWALGWPVDADTRAKVAGLLGHYGVLAPDHPMTGVLRAALDAAPRTGRRGGWRARRASSDGAG